MLVRTTEDGQSLYIKYLKNEHNHQCSKVSLRSLQSIAEDNFLINENFLKFQKLHAHLPKQRRLDPETKKEVKTMLDNNANKKLVLHYLQEKSHDKVTILKDLHNLGARKSSKDITVENVAEKMKKSPGN
jgi:hypothetical protein